MTEPSSEENDNETAADQVFADKLEAARPVPAAGFRGALGRHLAALDPGYGPRPRHLWLLSGGYLVAGGVLLLIGALQTGVL